MLKKIKRFVILTLVAFCTMSTSWVLLYKWAPVKWTPLMLKRTVQNIGEKDYKNTRTWVDLEDISPVMVRAVMASEDGRFMEHWGFDLKELIKMKKEHKSKGKKIRGCSTISQQVAKNCFTFCGHSWWRKGFETYYTVLIELFWSKERIMEVYLNVIETGDGIYGVDAVAWQNFGRGANRLTRANCALIAATLPNPLKFSSKEPSRYMLRRQTQIMQQMRNLGKLKWEE